MDPVERLVATAGLAECDCVRDAENMIADPDHEPAERSQCLEWRKAEPRDQHQAAEHLRRDDIHREVDDAESKRDARPGTPRRRRFGARRCRRPRWRIRGFLGDLSECCQESLGWKWNQLT